MACAEEITVSMRREALAVKLSRQLLNPLSPFLPRLLLDPLLRGQFFIAQHVVAEDLGRRSHPANFVLANQPRE